MLILHVVCRRDRLSKYAVPKRVRCYICCARFHDSVNLEIARAPFRDREIAQPSRYWPHNTAKSASLPTNQPSHTKVAGSMKISRRNPCSPFFSVSYSINRHKII